MPQKSRLKCYFGCVIDGPLHHFPKITNDTWDQEKIIKFNKWKNVLDPSMQEKGNEYIYNSVQLCYRHFESCYRLQTRILTRNAVPTLNLVQVNNETNQERVNRQPALPEGPVSPVASTSYQDTSSSLIISNRPPTPPAKHTAPKHVSQTTVPPVASTSCQVTSSSLITSDQPPIHSIKQTSRKHESRFKRQLDVRYDITFQKTIMALKRKLAILSAKYKNNTKKLQAVQKLSMSKSFLSIFEKLPTPIQTFTKLQLKGTKKPRGRRFTNEEKILALSIFKQSPKAYNFLKQLFILPSKRCLQKLLGSFLIKPGVNKNIIENLKNLVKRMPEEKKLVNLLFDEISLAPGVEYNKVLDQINGFEDFGSKRNKTLADHALVFMIKGIKTKTKQPICYTFCKSSTKKNELKNLLVEIIRNLNYAGLKVIATICDQSTTNVSVIRSLQDETKEKYLRQEKEYHTNAFEVDGIKVFPLFDPPHLLKGVRNNLLTKAATYKQNGKIKTAKWEHLEMLLNMDVGDNEIRLVNKLTETHIKKEKIPKMKVKYAAQVFSQRVSSAMRFLAKHKVLPPECEETAEFLLIFDQLFDSFNGHSYQNTPKKYKDCLKNNSPHFQLWNDLLPILESIKFESKSPKNMLCKYESIPSVKNFIHNIKTFKEMWSYLNENHNVKNLITRNFNQDPLENFFSNIRSNGVRNINPTCNQFQNAFKTLIINNYNSPHSVGANCEQDNNKSMQSLLSLIKSNHVDFQTDNFACEIDALLLMMTEIKYNDSLLHVESKKYVTGYVVKKCKTKIFKSCNVCTGDFCRSEYDLESFNFEADYTKKSLFHPSLKFIDLMNDIYYVIVACLRDFPQSMALKNKIKFFVNCACDYSIITCEKHRINLINYIIDLSINIIIHSWCLGVNRLLSGKLCEFDKNDLIKQQAYDYYNKRKK